MERAPLHDDISDAPQGGVAHWLKTSDGLRIRVGHWSKADVKGTVLVFPGRTEFIEKYGRTAQSLLDRGYASLVIDWRGQGIADRMTPNPNVGHVDHFIDYQHDVAAVVEHLNELDLPRPYFLLGHSMGGCIGLRALFEGLDVQAAAFSAPMWGIQLAAALRPLAWGLSSMSTHLGFDQSLAPGQVYEPYVLHASFDTNTLTADRSMFDSLRDQLNTHPELGLGGPSLRWLHTSLREMHRLSNQNAPSIPCTTFLGTKEAIVDPVRIRERMGTWPNGTLRVLANGRHEMLMDNEGLRNCIFDETAALFDANHPSI